MKGEAQAGHVGCSRRWLDHAKPRLSVVAVRCRWPLPQAAASHTYVHELYASVILHTVTTA